MTPTQFVAWRAARGWSKPEAADALGISLSQIYNYESGIDRGKKYTAAPIPRAVALACAMLNRWPTLRDYPG